MSKKHAPVASIKAARDKANLFQREAAELVGHSRRSWQDWESGKTPMLMCILKEFCELAEVKL